MLKITQSYVIYCCLLSKVYTIIFQFKISIKIFEKLQHKLKKRDN